METFETGNGRAFYRKSGSSIDVSWNPGDIKSTMYTATTGDSTEHTEEGSGRSFDRVWLTTNERTGDGDWVIERVATHDDKGRTFVRQYRTDPIHSFRLFRQHDHVTSIDDKLVSINSQTAEVRAEQCLKPENGIPRLVPGRFDRNSGTFSFDNPDNTRTIESFSPGRADVVKRDGTIEGTTVSGDKSTLKPNGEARVLHADQTGVRLNADGTIDRWGPQEKDNANREVLSPEEKNYLKAHNDIDRRDFAEIHRRFIEKPEKLAEFYKELGTIDGANNLTDQEKTALRRDIMHHVAYPGEIYQGRSPSCNVSVVQRD